MVDRTKLWAALALAALAIAWGAIPLFVRNDVPAIGLVGVRVAFGAIALIAVAAALRKLEWPQMHRGRVVVAGILLAAHWTTFFEAIKHASVAIALAILYVGPIVAALLSGPILKEHVAPRLWGALAIAAVGTTLVVQPWIEDSDQFVTTRGLVMAIVSAVLLAALLLVGKPAAQGLGGLAMAIGELTVASIVLLVPTVNAVRNHPDQLVNFLILGAVFTGLAGYVYWDAMARIPLAAVSVIMYLEPASAVVWAALFLDEIPNATGWMGVALVLVGGAIAASASATSNEKEAVGAGSTV